MNRLGPEATQRMPVSQMISTTASALAVFFYILYKKEWSVLFNWRWLVLFVLFGLLISPVLYW